MLKKHLLLFLLLVSFILAWPALTSATANTVHIINISGEITPAMSAFLIDSLAEAESSGASAVLLQVSTLGGRVDAALAMRDAILNCKVPLAVYVENRAISAGALITLAAEKIVMAPGSQVGAAEPVPNEAKARAFVSGEFQSTAEKRGRDPQVAMAMVDAAIEIEGLVGKDAILSLTAEEASRTGYADYLAGSQADALTALGWNKLEIIAVKPDFKIKIAQFLTSSEVAAILLIIAMIAFVAELFIPGFGAAGFLSIFCFILYFAGSFLAGHTQWWTALIFLAGLILVGIELFVPGFGVFGISGMVALVLAIILAAPSLQQGVFLLAVALIAVAIALPVFIKFFGSSRLFNRLVLATTEQPELGYTHITASKTDLVGKSGRAITPLRPVGSIEIGSMRLDAMAQGSFIDQGTSVQVIQVAGSKIIVAAQAEGEERS